MRLLYPIASLLLSLLISLSALAQSGADPAVTSRNLQPNPLAGVGSPFTLSFRIGNNGAAPISGIGEGNANRMQFGICLGKCVPNPASTAALSGPLLTYFDVVYNPNSNCFEGRQKQNVVIAETSVFSLSIAAIVTTASTNTATNDIGASCNISPNGNANPQPTDNDFASIYTHTETTALPVALVEFGVKVQTDRSVLVSWQTSWERANKGYVIERSKDLKTFEEVGHVSEVAANSSSLSSYQFVDKSPYRGRSYYRLRQLDQDGSSQTYPAKWVELEARYGVYPNPVIGSSFSLDLDEPTTAQLQFYDSRGVELSLTRSVLSEFSAQLSSPSPLSSGVYVLRVEERGNIRQHRLVVP